MSDDRQARLAALAAKAGRLPRQSMDQDTDPDINSDNNIINNDSNHRAVAEKTKTKALSFRNYVPKDASLDDNDDDTNIIQKDKNLSKKRQKTSNNNSASRLVSNTSTSHKSALEIALAKTDREARLAAGQSVDDDDAKDDHVGGGGMWNTGGSVAVTPSTTKKVNWDLKRDIQQKMEKLEKRTQRAIVQLLRERLEKEAAMGMEGGEDDID